MNPGSRLSHEELLSSVRPQPLGQHDLRILRSYLQDAQQKGLDVVLAPDPEGSLEAAAGEGVLLLKSAALNADFLLVHVDAGRGFLRRRNSHILTFFSPPAKSEWFPFLSPGSLKLALAQISNMYQYRRRPRVQKKLRPVRRPTMALDDA